MRYVYTDTPSDAQAIAHWTMLTNPQALAGSPLNFPFFQAFFPHDAVSLWPV